MELGSGPAVQGQIISVFLKQNLIMKSIFFKFMNEKIVREINGYPISEVNF